MGRIETLKEHFNKNSYVVLQNFVDMDYIRWARPYFEHRFFIDKDYKMSAAKAAVPLGKTYHGDPLAEVLLHTLKPEVEEVVDKELYPTYAFTRLYEAGQHLIKHKDRPACEYSLTLPINYTGWPIVVEGIGIELSPGDVLLYKGRELQHWREPLIEGHQIQLHLHYVDANGPCAEWKYDKRRKYSQQPFLQ